MKEEKKRQGSSLLNDDYQLLPSEESKWCQEPLFTTHGRATEHT